jgi:hypothetical protein
LKLLRTIRLDPSDTFIFPSAAIPGEWAISGAFVFSDVEPGTLAGKELAAFRSGFLGVPSLGWSTLVQIVEADAEQRCAAIEVVARCLVERFGAPDLATARAAAEEEIDFAASLCVHAPDTLVAVRRSDDGGTIRETFRRLQPRHEPKKWQVLSFLDAEADDEPAPAVDLGALARRERE